jgi:hypothetical protein
MNPSDFEGTGLNFGISLTKSFKFKPFVGAYRPEWNPTAEILNAETFPKEVGAAEIGDRIANCSAISDDLSREKEGGKFGAGDKKLDSRELY